MVGSLGILIVQILSTYRVMSISVKHTFSPSSIWKANSRLMYLTGPSIVLTSPKIAFPTAQIMEVGFQVIGWGVVFCPSPVLLMSLVSSNGRSVFSFGLCAPAIIKRNYYSFLAFNGRLVIMINPAVFYSGNTHLPWHSMLWPTIDGLRFCFLVDFLMLLDSL